MRDTAPSNDGLQALGAPGERSFDDAPVVIEVSHVEKTFRIPDTKVDSLKERVVRPLTRINHRELHAVRDLSFEVRQGEFFGIVGRNGSGKSTLLKMLAGIYRPDVGRVRMAGRVSPFIELGVGFNPELPARENTLLNGVLMGLSRKEAERRFDAVLEFAELEDFAELKLKNYSSGMMVRLAFSIMVQADADVMLIDEVLAVGDAAFGQKCMDVFHQRRREGKTIILVTHDMSTVQAMCDRAMLLHDGELQFIGDPEDAAMRYYRLNFEAPAGASKTGEIGEYEPVITTNVRVAHAALVDAEGTPTENVEQGAPIALEVELVANKELDEPAFAIHLRNEDGIIVHGFRRILDADVLPGERIRLAGTMENPLQPGRHSIECWVYGNVTGSEIGIQAMQLLEFVVYGLGDGSGIVRLAHDVDVAVVRGAEA